ncbi:MAG: molybdopterin-guanine dinucleotide biosynthesis protein MobB [Rubrivivax sp.]|nr:molybdopterin-guanine dinucleotide biosynthesis protein MobB [Rubrivivax sp.]
MKIFGIAGRSGMGKTTLLERLVPELSARGLVASLIKHSHKTSTSTSTGRAGIRIACAKPAAARCCCWATTAGR